MSVFAAQAKERELKQRLALVMPTATFREALDADGFPALEVTLGADIALVKIVTDSNAGRVDGLGLPQRVYSPHIIQMLQDTAAGKVLTAKMTAAVAKMGCKIKIRETAVSSLTLAAFDADFAAATTVCELPSDEINPLTTSN